MPLFVLEPPAYYVHHYNGPVIERVLPLSEARKACAGRGVHADACAWTSNGTCHLIIPSNGPLRNRAYRGHELAHCNGWDHASHPASEQDPLKAIRRSCALHNARPPLSSAVVRTIIRPARDDDVLPAFRRRCSFARAG